VELKPVAVGIGERRTVTDPAVEGVHREPHVLLFELAPRITHVFDAEGERAAERRKCKRQVPSLILDPQLTGGVRVPREPERLTVERVSARQVFDRQRDEVDAPDLHQGIVPSGYGA
jgi:hypothetical protein